MTLKLEFATERDAFRVAEIFWTAFRSNELFLSKIPTPRAYAGMLDALIRRSLAGIRDPHIATLVVRDTELDNKVVSFANWTLPSASSEDVLPSAWPMETRMDVVEAWVERISEAEKKALGGRPCYHLTFLATDLKHERRGAATMLIQWALEKCRTENFPAWLESTLESAALYQKLGFKSQGNINMILPDGTHYEEIGLLFQPNTEQDTNA